MIAGCSRVPEGSDSAGGDSSAAAVKYSVQIPDLSGSLCAAPLWVAKQRGYFEEEGVEVEEVSADVDTQKTGLNNGTFPVGMGDFSTFESMESGVQTTVVDAVNLGCIKVVARSDDDSVSSADDLKGKTVAVNKIGGTPYQVLALWLQREANLSIGTGGRRREGVRVR
jgi:NitT/TauT family transport system substrate-binding protein